MKKFLLVISILIVILLAVVAINEVKFNKEVKTMTFEELLEKGTSSYDIIILLVSSRLPLPTQTS